MIPGRVERHEERADAAAAAARLRRREHDRDRRRLGVRHPDLPPVEHVAAIVERRGRLLIRGVRSRLLFRQREGADRLPRRQPPQPRLLLRVGAELGDGFGDQRIVHARDHGDDGARPRDRFDRERVARIVASRAAPFGRDRHAEQAARRQLRHELARKAAVGVDAGRGRRDALRRECRDLLLKGRLLGTEVENHARLLNHLPGPAVLCLMQKSLFSVALAATLLVQPGAATAQSGGVIDLRDLKPRELQSAVFTLAAPQSVRVEAVGSESQHERGTFSWVTAMWNGKDTNENRRDPWMGNAWILDLKTRRVVWQLSTSQTERGRRSTRRFDGTVPLPAGTYEAFYAAFPNWYLANEDGDTNTAQRFLNWLHDAGFEDFKLTIHADHRLLAGADAERARRDIDNGAVVTLRGDGTMKYLQSGFDARPRDRGRSLRRRRGPRRRRVRHRVDRQRGHARPGMETDMAGLRTRRRGREKSRRPFHETAAGRALRGLLLDRRRRTMSAPGMRRRRRIPTRGAWRSASPTPARAPPSSRSRMSTCPPPRRSPHSRASATATRDRAPSRSNRATDVRVYALGEGTGRLVDYGWITSVGDRSEDLGDALRRHRARGRRGEEPARRSRHPPRQGQLRPPLRHRRFPLVRRVERAAARRRATLGHHGHPSEIAPNDEGANSQGAKPQLPRSPLPTPNSQGNQLELRMIVATIFFSSSASSITGS